MAISTQISEILQWLDDGIIRRSEVRMQVGLTLVESGGSTRDVMGLPSWVRDDLIEWARQFEETKTWWLISSGGSRDISEEGIKLLALLKEAGLVS
jgi:hypothetical protein